MRQLLDIFSKDIAKENFTTKEVIIFGVIAPLVLVLVCGFSWWLIWNLTNNI